MHHPPRARFDTLFADPRHFRADCRLLRTAIRRGWLDDAPPDDREALVDRLEAACADWRERNSDGPRRVNGAFTRGLLAQVWAAIEMSRANTLAIRREAASLLGWNGTGRPRTRPRPAERPRCVDANTVRRLLLAAGHDLARVRSIVVAVDPPDAPGAWAQRITLAAVPDRVYGWRVWLVCPRCKCRRGHLYPVRFGVRCRKCAGIGYRESVA
ncbi:MAG: hypothetical protein KF699_16720 [Phycisphaeraceae bacterium]|nr:hypothetical protein [Phycisphaeraceae bacterium]